MGSLQCEEVVHKHVGKCKSKIGLKRLFIQHSAKVKNNLCKVSITVASS